MKDIVCGREVHASTTLVSDYGDQPYYFCSKACQNNFVQNPLRYVDKSKSVSSTEGSPLINEQGNEISNTV